MRFFLLSLLILFSFSFSSAQQRNCKSNVPFFYTFNAAQLAKHLTKNCNDDSEKVCAIHDWMTHHIKYDVKKWMRFDYRQNSIPKILRKRKATCEGYTDLFNELCRLSNIKSVSVAGYTKGINVDITDKFYLDEHIWNAVYINNEWKYIDVCWDAGIIKYSKQTLLGKMLHVVSGGKQDVYKFKIHFKQHPSYSYYLCSGTFFKTDHLPMNPLWQNYPLVSIQEFQKDSSYYFKKHNLSESAVTIKNERDSSNKQKYYNLTAKEQKIADGINGYQFNFRNHFCIGNSFNLLAQSNIPKINIADRDTISQHNLCNQILSQINNAVLHYDSNAFYLNQQRDELIESNNKKKSILANQNKSLINSTEKILYNLKKGNNKLKQTNKSIRTQLSTTQKKLQKALKDISFFMNKDQNPPTDTLELKNEIYILNDCIAERQKKLTDAYKQIDSLSKNIIEHFQQYKKQSQRIRELASIVNSIRLQYYDDYDYEIKFFKDTLISSKFPVDSLLFSDNFFSLDFLINKQKNIKQEFDKRFDLYKIKLQLLKENKNYRSAFLIEEYQSNIHQLEEASQLHTEHLNNFQNTIYTLNSFCKQQKPVVKRELSYYTLENTIGENIYSIKAKYIKHHSKSLLETSNVLKRKLLSQKKRVEKVKSGKGKNDTQLM